MKKKYNYWLWLCIFISLVDLCFVFLAKANGAIDWKEFPKSVMESAQMVTFDADYDGLFENAKSGSDAYFLFFSFLCVVTPVVWGGAVLNVFFDISSSLRYMFGKRFRPCYLFSELNEDSLELAKSLSAKSKCLCLFFGVGSEDETELREDAKGEGFILKKESEMFFLRNPKSLRNDFVYFEISRDQDQNVFRARELIERYSKKYGEADYRRLKVVIFSEQKETPLAVSSIDKKGFPVQIIDRNRFFANDLFFKKPLYLALSNQTDVVSVLIVGGTELAKTLFKTAVWCGQLGGKFKFKIAMMDNDADLLESQLRFECPGIFENNYDISFIKSELNTAAFIESLDSKCADANYICVCCEGDNNNIETALKLRSHFIARDVVAKNNPIIAVYVKDSTKNELLPEFSIFAKERRKRKSLDLRSEEKFSYNLISFGGDNQLFSSDIVDSDLDKLAFNVHYAYELAFDSSVSEMTVRKQYWENEINLRADRAHALHIRYKLFSLGYDFLPLELASQSQIAQSQQLLTQLQQRLASAVDSDNPWLAMLEHDRWNAYMQSEGWRPMSIKDVEACKEHKNVQAKLHACLCSWDELDALNDYDPNFKEYDKRLVRDIPKLLGLVDGVENISRVKYVLVQSPLCQGREAL